MQITKELVSKMKPGDIIQFHKPNLGIWNLYYWTHTIMYIGNDMIIQAGHPVTSQNIYDYFKGKTIDNLAILRAKNISLSTINKVIEFATKQVNKPYDIWSIWRLTKQLDPPQDHPGYGYYCTELVWASYFSQGIDLDINHFGMINPMEIYMNNKLSLIYVYDRFKPFPYIRFY